MLALQLPPEIEQRLDAAAERAGRTREDCVAAAILAFIEAQEDYHLAVARLNKARPGIPLEEVERQLGLAG